MRVRWPRFEVMVIAGVALLAFVITLVVLASASGTRARKASRDLLAAQAPPVTSSALHPEDFGITAEDFLRPAVAAVDTGLEYTPFRPRLSRWTPELISKYWISPRQIATEIVGSLNDQNMRRLFESVP